MSGFGNINNNLFYSTVIGGSIKLIVLNNYIAFHNTSRQYKWAVEQFRSHDRSVTPWLFVLLHGSPYHTYVKHYKVINTSVGGGLKLLHSSSRLSNNEHDSVPLMFVGP